MTRSARLLRLARRLERLAKSRFPVDLDKTVDENVPVDPHKYPGILTETLGGPDRKRHRPHQYEGPRGIADVEDDEEEELVE